MGIHSSIRFESPVATIRDVRCRPPLSTCSAEEYASSHQVVLVRSGVFVKHSGPDQILAEPVHALFFNQAEGFWVSHPAGEGDDCTVLSFCTDVLCDAVAVYDPGVRDRPETPFTHRMALASPQTLLAYQLLRRSMHKGTECLVAEEAAVTILAAVLRQAYAPTGGGRRPRGTRAAASQHTLVEAVRLLLASDPGAGTSLATLSSAVSCSPYHLARAFAHEIGLSLHQYRLRLRLALALEQLSNGVRNLSRLALELGFASHSHFTTTFQKVFNLPPSAFRDHCPAHARRELRALVALPPMR
jgi:AraC family transcriptional regulator